MKTNLKIVITLISIILFSSKGFGQTFTSVSKTCGSCYLSVSANSKIGDYCPHCNVRWGYENSTRSGATSTYKSSPEIKSKDQVYSVATTKTFFHNTASSDSQRKAYLIYGEIVFARSETNGYVYIIFVNGNGQVTKGWISKADLVPYR
jgi:hypothetical protein